MRKRSNTLYAESVEEYTAKALNPVNQSYLPNGPIQRSNSKKKINASSLLPLLFTEDKSRSIQEIPYTYSNISGNSTPTSDSNDSAYWSEFDFGTDQHSSEPSSKVKDYKLSEDDNSHPEEATCCTDSTEDTPCSSPEIVQKTATKKFMVIGLNGSGRHSLVNSIFDSQGKEGQSSLRQTMDLIIKTRKEAYCETKYQFWMRALNDNRFDGLVKVYYRNASVFLFVYSVTDRESFEILNEAIESVLKEVPREKFVGILLGNKCDLERHRKVDISEGESLKEKYNLSLFLETHVDDQFSKEALFSFLNRRG